VPGCVQAFQLGVLLRVDLADGLEHERVGNVRDGQLLLGDLVGDRLTVQRHGNQLELVAVQDQRTRRIAADLQLRPDQRVLFADVDVEVDGLDPERRRGVVL
jgi:hypothetical protein